MKILVINPILSTIEHRGGTISPMALSRTMIHNLCCGFVENGDTVTLATSSDFKPEKEEKLPYKTLFFKNVLRRIALPERIPFSLEFFKFMRTHSTEYDMVIASEAFQFYTLAAAIAAPAKTIIWHEMNCHQRMMLKMPSRLWHHMVIPLAFRRIAGIIPRSESARQFISRYHTRVSPTSVDNCVNSSVFKPSALKKRQVISSSQLIRRKGIDQIINAFAKFHNLPGYEDIELVIAGSGEDEASLRSLVKDYGLEKNIHFTGYLDRDELAKEIAQSIAFLVYTRKDLNMVSITESLCAGTPVLTNTVPASASFINSHGLGIVKDNWTEVDLKAMVDSCETLSKRCNETRPLLTHTNCARTMTDIFADFTSNHINNIKKTNRHNAIKK